MPVQTGNANGSGRHVNGSLVVLAATKAGLYLFQSDRARAAWSRGGPYLAPCEVSHATYDERDGSIWAAVNGDQPRVYRSPDLGATWEAMGDPLPGDLVWHVEPGRPDQPGTVYAGVRPAALFRSDDGGATWRGLDGLNRHETREEWWEGGGGLCLHTIILPLDRPGRIFVAISVAGVFRSDDDGETWAPMNEGTTDFVEMIIQEKGEAPKHRGVHRCVHKVVVHPGNPDVMFQQNHLGVFRSDDAGVSWRSIGDGLPSDFGFPIAIGAGEQPSIFVVPEDGNTLRTKDYLAVWRSEDGGGSWIEASDGLPSGEQNVLREGMAADWFHPTGVYVGTKAGGLYASSDGGIHFTALAEDLPYVRSVKVAHLG
jgi:photosystem II stability/assembly factor-like uncharacterized protein